ncbi:uroporphyrinogen decarboxylase [Terrimonas sp. NA20]|uniref:Uroporphyrinogen decarboxylase n=1 Tax=Terrimonas ginsenosidimutans TaxID=2908004 RepID=A0ABS9KQM8_9BACT|nr:uroporphyrinogen decarboxylase [Terrimonas ginsenosidimutans]MCG2614608.1 uroporphyrinogen decarboxylase [Terrimonas ginsenosidimutans]
MNTAELKAKADPSIKNDLFLRALRGEEVSRPPVWMMRQAGRYLPEYIVLRNKYGFFERCQTPELACEITLQPIDIVGPDAAILFSDILVVPQAMGLVVELIENKGPVLPDPIQTEKDFDRIVVPDVNDRLHYVFDAIKMIKQELNGRVPLIGFAGAPWTLLCYMVQGKGSKTFDEAKAFCYRHPALAHRLLQMITDTTIAYLKQQIKAGADAVQIFDSWGGLLSPVDFEEFSLKYIRQIVAAVKNEAPTIIFAKGAWFALEEMASTGAHGLGIDWCITADKARQFAGNNVTLQGNFDPAKLFLTPAEIKKEVNKMINAFGPQRYIANLGHGILPTVPVDHAKAFVNAVKEWKA